MKALIDSGWFNEMSCNNKMNSLKRTETPIIALTVNLYRYEFSELTLSDIRVKLKYCLQTQL